MIVKVLKIVERQSKTKIDGFGAWGQYNLLVFRQEEGKILAI